MLDFTSHYVLIIIAVTVFQLATAFFTSWLANRKGYDLALWFLFGLFFGIIPLLTMGFVPARDDNAKIVRRCPYCAEMIRYNAIICKHCGKEIGELSADNEIKLGEPTETEFKFIVTDGETAFEPKALERISDKAVLYSSPNKSSGIIETFDIARTIELNKIDGEWLNVTVNKKISGWIYAPKYMEKLYSLEKC